MSSMIGRKIRLTRNQVAPALKDGEALGRETYAAGTELEVERASEWHLDCRVLGTEHSARFDRQKVAFETID